MKMSFHSHADKTHFHIKSFARSLALKKRHKTIRKWPNEGRGGINQGCTLIGKEAKNNDRGTNTKIREKELKGRWK